MNPRRAGVVLAAIGIAGFVMLGYAWHGAQHAKYVPLQAPWVISGGLGGLALIGLAAASGHIYAGRLDDEAHREAWNGFTREVIDVLSARPVSPKARGGAASKKRGASR